MNGLIPILLLVIILWKVFAVSPIAETQAKALLSERAAIIDVREPVEFRAGNLPSAINIPLGALEREIPARFPDRNTPLLLHCATGARSASGESILRNLGYQRVGNLGGFSRAQAIIQQQSPPSP
jgi:phage shock protein E